ncbi:MAG: methyltransferase domain-containing protein [Betaproteobacteria bacterium]|nr:methyltransferase domain-containing protein [Betaproteobacteria bacterium]
MLPSAAPVMEFCSWVSPMPYDGVMRIPLLSACALVAALTPTWATSQVLDTDVPFVVSPPAVTQAMLDLARVGPKDFVIDLGSGDGRIVILAAKKYGARGLGVEIDPKLVSVSRENARKADVTARAEFRDEDLFKTDLTRASVITMYLLPDVNLLLRPRLLALKPGTRIVSHDWDMGDWPPDEEVTIPVPEKALGVSKTSRVMRWTVPARLEGVWCSKDWKGKQLTIRQKYQRAEGTLGQTSVDGTIEGMRLRSNVGDGTLIGDRLTFDAKSVAKGEWRRQLCGK